MNFLLNFLYRKKNNFLFFPNRNLKLICVINIKIQFKNVGPGTVQNFETQMRHSKNKKYHPSVRLQTVRALDAPWHDQLKSWVNNLTNSAPRANIRKRGIYKGFYCLAQKKKRGKIRKRRGRNKDFSPKYLPPIKIVVQELP